MVNFNENSMKILEKRYLLKDENGNIIETPDQMLERVANVVCGDDVELKKKVLEMMNDLRFLPNTPTLMNAGTTNMLSACFVIDIDDSLESIIHEAGWQQSLIHKLGGGVGINFSKLRPKGDIIRTTGGITSGILGFLEVFNVLSEIIRQGGKRDGANMGLLNIDHPEIQDWIMAKAETEGRFRNFNLSILVTDMFMEAVEKDLDWELKFKGKVYKVVKAKYLFDLIVKSAWECGCPGMVFVDEINRNNPLADKGMWIETTNPCGEQPLYVGMYNNELIAESCNLGSLNLSKYVIEPDILLSKYTWQELFDFEKFKKDIEVAVEFLDMVIDVNKYPFEFIEKGTKLTRKIGLGITGLHECLTKMSIRYDSDEALSFIGSVMDVLKHVSHKKSEELGKIKENYPLSEKTGIMRRNLFTTTIAPTGSIGRLMVGHPYSLGIEPPYGMYTKSNIIDSKIEDGMHPLLVKILKEKGLFTKEIVDEIIKDGKSIQHIKEIPDYIRKLFLTADEISIEKHIEVQALVQKYVDNAVSKTVNMRNDATMEDVSKAFIMAWKSGCKGVTIYRDWSKDKQVFEAGKDEELRPIDDLAPRPSMLPALSFTKKTACNTMFLHPTFLWDMKRSALESFIDTSGKGGCRPMQDGLAICISVYQRILQEISPEFARNALSIVMSHLSNVTCPACREEIRKQKYEKVKHPVDAYSCPAAVAEVMKFMLEHEIEVKIDGKLYKDFIGVDVGSEGGTLIKQMLGIQQKSGLVENISIKKCKDCGAELIRQEGCANMLCPVCGQGGCI